VKKLSMKIVLNSTVLWGSGKSERLAVNRHFVALMSAREVENSELYQA